MRAMNLNKGFLSVGVLAVVLGGAGCQTPPATNNANTNTSNANATPANVNAASTPTPGGTSVIDAREPETYRATLEFSVEVAGQNKGIKLPIEVARRGTDRRYAFNLPAIGQVIFLDKADQRYLIVPSRKQYAELGPEMTGFDVRSMTPAQMVEQLKNQQGVERVGEELYKGRTVIKYRHAATARTGSQAGDVTTESFIYVDKETGLPLYSELRGQSSGNVQGVSSGRLAAEMRDIQTQADESLFNLPEGYAKLTPEQVKQQLSALAGLAQIILQGINAQGGTSSSSSGTTTTTTASPTPAASASPATR